MRIDSPLLKLPVRFCGETLAREVSALPASAWMEHPQKFDGNIAVPLVSPGGALNDEFFGQMAPTQWLRHCPYIVQIMQALDSTWGRSRLMGLQPGAGVPEHVDIHYYWRTHLRIHIPVITNPEVAFTCAGETVHMAPGECWLLDSFFTHDVANRGNETRIHLVLDTVGSYTLWDLIRASRSGVEEKLIGPREAPQRPLGFEQINASMVMSPWEMKTHLAYITDWTDEQPGRDETLAILDRFVMAWGGAWARYGPSEQSIPIYMQLLAQVRHDLATYTGPSPTMRNTVPLIDTIQKFILAFAIYPEVVERFQASRQGSKAKITA